MRYYWYLYIFVWKPHSEIHRLYIHTVPEKLFLFVLPYGFVFEELHGWAVKFSRKNQLWGPGGFSLMNWFRFHPGFSACNIHTAGRRIVTVGNLKAAFFCWTDPPIYIHSYIYIHIYIYPIGNLLLLVKLVITVCFFPTSIGLDFFGTST